MQKLYAFVPFLLICCSGFSQSWTQYQKLVTQDRNSEEWFSFSVDISADRMISGAIYEDRNTFELDSLLNAGAVYIFEKNTSGNWTQKIKLVASDREAEDQFGFSVAIDGNYAVVGSYLDDEDELGNNFKFNSGSAYVFFRDLSGNWMQLQKLSAPDRESEDWFGLAVDIHGDHIIVGSIYNDLDPNMSTPISNGGAVYIYKKNSVGTFVFQQKVIASDRNTDDWFGGSVSIYGDHLIVSAINNDTDENGSNIISNAGAAYIFKNFGSTWTEIEKIVAADRGGDDSFGKSVSIDSALAIIGAYQEDENENGFDPKTGAGSAYIFKKNSANTWTQHQKLVASDRDSKDQFGWSVSLSADRAVVGARFEDHDISGGATFFESGSAYFFKEDANGIWYETEKVVSSDREDFDQLGYSVAIDEEQAVIGAYREDHDVAGQNYFERAGSAYIFYLNSGVGISAINRSPEIKVYPNPTTSRFTIVFEQDQYDIGIELRNAVGQLVYTINNMSGAKIIINPNIAPGIYFGRLITNQLKTNYFKLIVED